MNSVLTALVPIFVLIALGFAIHRWKFIDHQFWLPCERLNYFCMFPALMFAQIAKADFSNYPIGAFVISLLGAVSIGGAFLFLWKWAVGQNGSTFSSVIQGALRPNTYVGVAAAALLFGSPGITLTSLSIAISIPILNVASIVVLMVHSGKGKPSPAELGLALVKNPVIVAVCLGLLFNACGLPRPAAVFSTLDVLGAASLPLGLLAVGAGLDLRLASEARSAVFLSSMVKLVLVPAVTATLAHASGLTGTAFGIVVLFNSLPCTPSAYIMTKLLGGDHRLAASIISIQTVAAALTIPLVLSLSARLHF
ncbi:AEC family transporter [Piscinibacter terrae]|uniref:AEC family transporter n=1 Tax=Piscinibacter terrae TaxID=2496871 RepID=A0A3N7JSH0_9BURK|nr:AEC family transporter [Albitalea terrae]RQP21955.1 AEC family transporter [Albitalea terrae]